MGVRVLLAEDNPTNQMIAMHMLGRLGCVSELVADGFEVLQRLEQASFDLVLMDVQMPRVDGLQATMEIRRREADGSLLTRRGGGRGRLPVIAMTANAAEGDRERCLASQMDDYLSKPVTLEQLAQVLGYWVEQGCQASHPAATSALSSGLPALNRERLEEVSQGDAEFEQDFLQCLLDDVATSLTRLQAALDPFNPGRAAALLHGIVGACRTVGAEALGQVARVAEDQAKSPGFVPGPNWIEPVTTARAQLVTAVEAHLSSHRR